MSSRINIPPLTRGLLLGLFVFTLLNAGARYRDWNSDRTEPIESRLYYPPYLTIVPGESFFYPWVLVTATFAEQNLVGLAITGVTLFYGGRYLERAWSSREFSKFMIIIALGPNLLTFLSYIGLYMLTDNTSLITTAISGGIAIQAAFIVSFKQLVPEHTVTLLRGLVRTRVKHFPAIFLLANTLSGIIIGTDTAMLLSWYGFLVSWIYLRFYRVSPSLISSATGGSTGAAAGATIKGDASDTFAFAAFFPDAVQPPIAAAADAIYNVLVTMRICTPFSAADVDASNEQASVRGTGGEASDLPSLLNPAGHGGRGGGGRREEAERRRALALRALDQRLHAQSARGVPPKAGGAPAGAPGTVSDASTPAAPSPPPTAPEQANDTVEQQPPSETTTTTTTIAQPDEAPGGQ